MTPFPPALSDWFAAKGWSLHPHQTAMLERAAKPATLLIAPTGGGKTLAGFLPTLAELATPHKGLHTLYISPLKALTADIRRNLRAPVEGANLPIRIEDRTGDTSYTQRRRQRADPPQILLTTPESLALLLSYEDAPRIFHGLQRVIVDEIHALAESRRGDQLMLCLSRLESLSPGLRRVGLSATVEDPPALARFLARNPDPCAILLADPGPDPDIRMLETAPPPWAGGGGRHAIPAILDQVRAHRTTLIFHNTRAQAELFFRDLWMQNDDGLPIGIHHGSLSREQRERVEAAMVTGQLRAIVCTGSLDLGIDWGDVDLVIQVGAPKNVKRLVQRIGRANHRYNAPSKALLVPANRFEVVECLAALQAVRDHDLDGEPRGPGPRDVLCQHILICAASAPFDAAALYAEVTSAGPYTALTRAEFGACLDFAATGGYALRAYDRWQRLKLTGGLWHLRDPRSAAVIRQNIGTIIDTETLKVRLKGRTGLPLGEIEEAFAATLTPGDTFLIGGEVVRYESLRELTVEVSRSPGRDPRVAVFNGTKFATSTLLTQRILALFQQSAWPELPAHTAAWLALQRKVSRLPEPHRLLCESFPHDGREHLCVYGFAGRNAQQTLGLLLTKRMEEEGLAPLGFVATDYATLIWGLEPVTDPLPLFDADRLRAGLEGWLAGNAVMKRTFRASAIIAGLIERSHQGRRKSGRQATFSSDILYDTLRRHDPGHLMLKITREEALRGLVDFGRIEGMLARIALQPDGGIDCLRLPRVTPLAAPLFLEAGRIPVVGAGRERLVADAAARLMQAAGLA
ncbi:ligase-associated DNA damage response DEXH box helicase [Paracoccaceae bacterium Fryx2]|nr:ligase-associated DNA damage response DEXH box helicase [Paracoccaceae bacterium Fryx2]